MASTEGHERGNDFSVGKQNYPSFSPPFSLLLSPPNPSSLSFLISPRFPSSPFRSRPLLLRLGSLGEHFRSPSGSGQSLSAKRYLVNFRLKISPIEQRSSGAFQEMKHQTGGLGGRVVTYLTYQCM